MVSVSVKCSRILGSKVLSVCWICSCTKHTAQYVLRTTLPTPPSPSVFQVTWCKLLATVTLCMSLGRITVSLQIPITNYHWWAGAACVDMILCLSVWSALASLAAPLYFSKSSFPPRTTLSTGQPAPPSLDTLGSHDLCLFSPEHYYITILLYYWCLATAIAP